MSVTIGSLKGLIKKSSPALLLAGLCLGLAAGCSGPLKVSYKARENPGAILREPTGIFIGKVKDARSAAALEEPREIGRIEATVFDISGGRLIIADGPAALVTEALAREFAAAGFEVSSAPAGAEFILKGELKEFRLDIVDRDRIAVEVAATLIEKDTGTAIWSGVAAERSERYAGVMGNSRASIERYMNATLAKVAGSIADNATAKVAAARTGEAPKGAIRAERQRPRPAPRTFGRMAIRTEPPRAKVYIGGVYYGLAPLTLELPPGVYELEIKQKGYKDGTEKVSVRKGDLTEIEMELAGE